LTHKTHQTKTNGLWGMMGDFALLGIVLVVIPILLVCLPFVWAIGWVTGK